MTPVIKILIGAIVTSIMAWVFYGPLGYGEGFADKLSSAATGALGSANATVSIQQDPLQRVAVLSGSVTDPAERAKLIAAVEAVPGIHSAVWAAGAPEAIAPPPVPPAAAPPPPPPAAAPPAPPVAEPPATAETITTCQTGVNAAIESKSIEFDTGTATLTASGQTLVDSLAAVLTPCAGTMVEVSGHTDPTGSPELNQQLSETRAATVVAALVAKGVPASRLVAKGYGSSRPRIPGDTPEANAQNRRIEFSVMANK